MIPELHFHFHESPDITEQLNRMEQMMASAAEQLAALKTQLADTTSDVLAKIEQLTGQLGELSPEAQATLDEIKAGVEQLDETIGDADGSDGTVPPPAEEGGQRDAVRFN